MLFRSNDTATTEIYTVGNTLSLHDALPMLEAMLAPMQHQHARIFAPDGRPARDEFVRQNIFVIRKPRAHG